MKTKTLWLTKDPSEAEYLVERTQDTVEYAPGTYVEEAVVARLCEDGQWKVHVARPK